ncbi:MAG: putative hydrolase, partial [Mycobacterium sp.]|nr:putative hydrolase [Mycobacterium sp.]
DFTPLWDDLGRIQTPLTLLRGALSPFVSDEDIAELQRRLPAADVEVVAEAGHSIQSDQPGLLAQRIEELVSAS